MRGPAIAFALAVGLGGVGISLAPGQALIPGELSKGHRAQRDDCLSCHTVLSGPATSKCEGCHKPGTIGVTTVAGAARSPENAKARAIHRAISGRCLECHAEHDDGSGRRKALHLDHASLPADLLQNCLDCHAPLRPRDGLHAAASSDACRTCHATQRWKPATFEHARFFRFDRHHPAQCTDCHRSAGDYKRYDCYGCHAHSEARIASEHREEGIRNFADCARCHRSGNEHETRRQGFDQGAPPEGGNDIQGGEGASPGGEGGGEGREHGGGHRRERREEDDD